LFVEAEKVLFNYLGVLQIPSIHTYDEYILYRSGHKKKEKGKSDMT
jgi:hypothetical protein